MFFLPSFLCKNQQVRKNKLLPRFKIFRIHFIRHSDRHCGSGPNIPFSPPKTPDGLRRVLPKPGFGKQIRGDELKRIQGGCGYRTQTRFPVQHRTRYAEKCYRRSHLGGGVRWCSSMKWVHKN